MSNLLREFKDFGSSKMILEEGTNSLGGKDLYMKGIFLQADIKNQNQRIYPLNEIQRAVENIRKRIQNGETIFGEGSHPADLEINLDRISHIITDMWMEGSNGMGKLKIMPTPLGNIVKTLLENGGKLGVSSRGSGDVNFNGVVQGFEIVTIDIVVQPSAPNAFPKPIYESLCTKQGYSMIDLSKEAIYNKDIHAQRELEKLIIKSIRDLKI